MGLENIPMDARRLVSSLKLHYIGAMHGYILRAHMNEHTLLEYVMIDLKWNHACIF